jgi:NAD(P)-dependent dehydrogenase (short-subunit alcohol dehydrogenase family)
VSLQGKVCAVTGAGSGIGRALATGLARRGARLAISDVDGVGLTETERQVQALGVDVHVAKVDVSARTEVAGWAEEVVQHYGVVHQLYNNAGIGTAALPLADVPYDDMHRVIDVNMWGVVHGCKEFLPHLVASGQGHLVNISSLNGIMAQPSGAAYCMSKFAVRALSEGLRAELLRDRVPVKVTVVHPGGVKTAIGALDEDELAAMPPAWRAAAVLHHLRRRRRRADPGRRGQGPRASPHRAGRPHRPDRAARPRALPADGGRLGPPHVLLSTFASVGIT